MNKASQAPANGTDSRHGHAAKRVLQVATRTVLLALVAVIALTAVTGTASAQAQHRAKQPVGFVYHWSTGSNGIVVQPVGSVPKHWALATVIRNWNAAAGLHVHQGRCSDFPRQHCVQVVSYNAENSGSVGDAVIYPNSETPTVVHLNRAYWGWSNVDSQAVTCHELGHAVGFTHDEPSGCTSQDNRETPSTWELDRATRAYLDAS
jgi:Dual-action HEIGH metallo-peptidase